MKKVIVVLFVVLVGLSSCGRRYTCPTYLKNENEKEDVRAKNVKTDEKTTSEKN